MVLTIPAITSQIPVFYARSYVKNVSGISANAFPEKHLNGAAGLGSMP